MPAGKRYCTNFGLCEKADRRKALKIRGWESAACPECGQPLDISGPRGRFPWRIVIFIIAIFLMSTAVEVYRYEPRLVGHGQLRTEVGFESFMLRLCNAGRAGAALSLSFVEAVRQRWEGAEEETAHENQETADGTCLSSQKESGTERGQEASTP